MPVCIRKEGALVASSKASAVGRGLGSQVSVVCGLLEEVWLQCAHHRVLHPDQHILQQASSTQTHCIS